MVTHISDTPIPKQLLTHDAFSKQSYRLVPSASPAESTSAQSTSHATFTGAHDSLRAGGPRSFSAEVSAPKHQLESRLDKASRCLFLTEHSRARLTRHLSIDIEQWDATQDNLKWTMHRNAFGMHMPIRQAMERQLVSHVGPLLYLNLFLSYDLFTQSGWR